jgi:hypothetical protein
LSAWLCLWPRSEWRYVVCRAVWCVVQCGVRCTMIQVCDVWCSKVQVCGVWCSMVQVCGGGRVYIPIWWAGAITAQGRVSRYTTGPLHGNHTAETTAASYQQPLAGAPRRGPSPPPKQEPVQPQELSLVPGSSCGSQEDSYGWTGSFLGELLLVRPLRSGASGPEATGVWLLGWLHESSGLRVRPGAGGRSAR